MEPTFVLQGRCIVKGKAEGEALVTKDNISFMGSTNPKTGIIIEKGHELEGVCMQGKILCFPCAKGSTGGSYMLYDAVKRGVGPIGILNVTPDPVCVIGAIVSELPTVAGVDITRIKTGDRLVVDAASGRIEVYRSAEPDAQ